MATLDYLYSYYICQQSITFNNHLSKLYRQYKNEHISYINKGYDFLDYDLELFLEKLIDEIDKIEDWKDIEKTRRIDNLVQSYHRLPDLLDYIHKILYFYNDYKKRLEETFFSLSALKDIQLADSRLCEISLDNRKHLCKLSFENIILYNDKRYDKKIPINVGKIDLSFKSARVAEMTGLLTGDCLKVNTVYDWHLMKEDNQLLKFCVLILNGNKKYIIQIICSDIDISLTSND